MKLKHYILPILIVISTVACKPKCHDVSNPDCEDYDPCYGKTRINSNFRVRPGDNGFKPPEQWCDLIPCDTFNASSVRFDMPLNNPDNSTYSWQIGTEATPRTGKGFEVDFSDYLDAGKWETTIPVTLTIRTPLNSCLTHAEDTLIKVTRELFFTRKITYPYNTDSAYSIFEGYLEDDPGKVFRIRIGYNNDKYYKKLLTYGKNIFLIGLPIADTILMPVGIFLDNSCSNFKHYKEITVSNQNPDLFKIFNEYSHGLMQQDYIYLGDKNYLFRFEFQVNGQTIVYKYRCKKIQ